jgi:hypothetical protein
LEVLLLSPIKKRLFLFLTLINWETEFFVGCFGEFHFHGFGFFHRDNLIDFSDFSDFPGGRGVGKRGFFTFSILLLLL